MAYQFKYLQGGDSSSLLLQRTDEKLFELREAKGQFWASIVEFMIGVRMLNTMMAEDASASFNSVLVAKFITAVVEEVYGSKKDRLGELMQDSDMVANYVLKDD